MYYHLFLPQFKEVMYLNASQSGVIR